MFRFKSFRSVVCTALCVLGVGLIPAANASLVTVNFIVASGSWNTFSGGTVYGIPAQPTFAGSLVIDNAGAPSGLITGIDALSRIVSFGLTTGSQVWTLADLTTTPNPISIFPAEIEFDGLGINVMNFGVRFSNSSIQFDYLGNVIDGFGIVASNNIGYLRGGDNIGMACNGCVSFTTEVSATSIAPIPEPTTYAMMLAGLGLLGFTARRRKQ